MIRRTFIAAAFLLLLTAPGWAQETKPNFSGTWTLDAAKSDFGPTPPPDSAVLIVDHKESAIKTKNTTKTAQGETVNERSITTDGKENTNKLRTMMGEQDVKSTTTWNGNKLSTSMKVDMQGMTLDMTDSWELSEDGKVLTISRDIKTPQGDFTQKMVFNKQ
jgi:hypothetical protein